MSCEAPRVGLKCIWLGHGCGHAADNLKVPSYIYVLAYKLFCTYFGMQWSRQPLPSCLQLGAWQSCWVYVCL